MEEYPTAVPALDFELGNTEGLTPEERERREYVDNVRQIGDSIAILRQQAREQE